MKEYIKLFEGLNAANGYEINDTPFTSTIKQVSGETAINLRCNKPDASIIIEDGKPRILTEVTITSVWNPTVSDKNTKVIIQGEVVLNGKVDCYSIEFAQGGHLTINPDARLRIWEGGIVNADAESASYFTLIEDGINATCSELLLHPNLTNNTNPVANVQIISRGYKQNVWQRFGVPAYDYITRSDINYPNASAIMYWDNSVGGWNNVTPSMEMKPFIGFEVTTSQPAPGDVYSMTTKIVGCTNANLEVVSGWNCLSNSFTGNMSTRNLLNKLKDYDILSIEIWVDGETWSTQTLESITIPRISNIITNILLESQNAVPNITLSYKDLIWNPSFENDVTSDLTRGLKSSLKSELILPDNPIFSDPIDAFADIDNSNLK